MSIPKTIYPQSEARRLCNHPCPHCGKSSRVDRNPQGGYNDSVDPDVAVIWRCPGELCNGHDGFWIESQ